ncbi:zinc-binding dehydrogenase [Actinacidiphila guanduensis]|uniref:NADPH:quinone reductase n=1 Tax=Actinacidiphila guanduensis TaxID=310781 RepID=A0A1G9ZHF2_9ACTN|nr:zinc-binding dehydrogenase [Actinacidiphila guanduensis]SDN20684.1 NADPH:quinone reductase [Actinacidiphila guanduensis]
MKTVLSTPQGTVLRDVDEPGPRSADQALVAVRAFSVNRGELALLAARTADWRPGQDIAGVVTEAAADGSGPAPGTRVVAQVEQGGWAEFVPVPTDRLTVLPDEVGVEQAAALPLAGLTALRTLRLLPGGLLGRRVLITGASGGVGRFQTEPAALGGADVTAVADARHGKALLALGATTVVPSAWDAAPGQDLVTESVGGDSLAAALKKIAPGGTIAVIGTSSGEKTPIDVYDFIGHEGARLVSYLSYAHPGPPAPDLALLVGLVATGRLHPTLARTCDWTHLPEVLTALRDRRLSGKAVLTIS